MLPQVLQTQYSKKDSVNHWNYLIDLERAILYLAMKAAVRVFNQFRTLSLKKLKVWTLLMLFVASLVFSQTLVNAAEIPILDEAELYGTNLCPSGYDLVKLDIYPVLCINSLENAKSGTRLNTIQTNIKDFASHKEFNLDYLKLKPLEVYNQYAEYDLDLRQFESTNDLPSVGKNLIVVGRINNSYHALIFDETQKNIYERQFSPDTEIKKELDEALDNKQTDNQTKVALIQQIISDLELGKRIEVIYKNPSSLAIDKEYPVTYFTYKEAEIPNSPTQKDFDALLDKLKEAIQKYRESLCVNSSQTVRINWREDSSFLTLFCVESTVKDGESVKSRAGRINQKLKALLMGEINVETLGIVNFSNLNHEKEVYSIGDEEAYAIVGYGSYSETPEVILLITESDVKLSANDTDSGISEAKANDPAKVDTLTSKAVDDIFSKIVKAVEIYEEKEDAAVKINFGAFKVSPIKYFFLRTWAEEAYSKEDSEAKETQGKITTAKIIFLVKGKGIYYNRNYRAVEIGNKLSKLANSKPLRFTPHNLNLFYIDKEEDTLKGLNIETEKSKVENYLEEEEPEQYIVIAAGNKPSSDDIVMTIFHNDVAVEIIDNETTEKKEVKNVELLLENMRNVLEVYRANKYLSLEILVVCLARFIYHISFSNDTKKEKERNIIAIICSVAILLHIFFPFVLFRDSTPKLVFLSSAWLIILALIIMFAVSELYQPRKRKDYIEKLKANSLKEENSLKEDIKYHVLKSLTFIFSLRDWAYISLFLISTYVLFDIYLFKQNLSMYTVLGFEAADRYFKNQFPKLLSIWILGFLGIYLIGFLILALDIIFLKKDLRALTKIKWNYFNHKRDTSTHPEAIICMLAILVFLFMLAMSAPYFPGAGTPYFAGVSAIAGLIFTWSASASIADFISGIILIFFTKVEEGDWVEIGNVKGKLKDQNLLVHHIKTPKNTLVTIPNAKVLRDIIINYTSSRRMTNEGNISENIAILHTNITLGYDISPTKVRKALKRAAEETNDIITPEKIDAMTPFKSRLAGYELKIEPAKNVTKLPSKERKLMAIGKIKNPYYEYDLKLMNLENVDELPQKGRSLVILAKINDLYHARIFDATEKIVMDEGRGKFLPSKELVQDLDATLVSQSINQQKKNELIRKVALSLSHTQYYYVRIINSIGQAIVDEKHNLFLPSKTLVRKLDKVQELLDELAQKSVKRKQDKLERTKNELKQEIVSELIRGLNSRIEYVDSRIHGIKIYIKEVESWLKHKRRDLQSNKVPIIWLLLREYNCIAGIIFLCEFPSFLSKFPNISKPSFVLLHNLSSRLRDLESQVHGLQLRLHDLRLHHSLLDSLNSELSLELRYHFEKSNLSSSDLKDLSEEDKRHLHSLYSKLKKNKDTLNLKPFVLVENLDDFYISYELNALLNPSVCFVKPELIPRIYSKLHEEIHQVCSEEGIEILSPHYEAAREGNAPAVPAPEEHLAIRRLRRSLRS